MREVLKRSLLLFVIFGIGSITFANNDKRVGMSLRLGGGISPDKLTFLEVSYHAIYPAESILKVNLPDSLHLKFGINAGVVSDSQKKGMAGLSIAVVYYVNSLNSEKIKPFLQLGTGIKYMDHRVNGQGLRTNFASHIGVGCELSVIDNHPIIISIFMQHLSNGGMDSDNHGIDSVFISLGFYF